MLDDWRLLRGQDVYLQGKVLQYCRYKPKDSSNDHDHCEFCMEKFQVGDVTYAYCTLDHGIWICDQCFKDFREQFNWELVDHNGDD